MTKNQEQAETTIIMKKKMNIYTVNVKQTVSQTYQIQAETKEEALRAASELWNEEKDSCHKDNFWDAAELRAKNEKTNPSQSELEYVDNK